MVVKGAGRIKVRDKPGSDAGRRQEGSQIAGVMGAADQTALDLFANCLNSLLGARSRARSQQQDSFRGAFPDRCMNVHNDLLALVLFSISNMYTGYNSLNFCYQ